jgi:hypothetical protein
MLTTAELVVAGLIFGVVVALSAWIVVSDSMSRKKRSKPERIES